ncbi:unnamed protein product [Protopolystoma xenopodis]|uniref:Innexin n=1 Tax=Protopolystoma xenopodis TaxID=117903 RepID=A0A3S5FGV2_9PLAT|nr:unnamed protein product [Protopolystoma xenopodis]
MPPFPAPPIPLRLLSPLEPVSTNNYQGSNDVTGFIFGLTVANYIRSGVDWPETTLFPRVAYCRVPGIRLVGVENAYTAQCALPINMLNEKIYIFMWFWIVFVAIVSSVSLCLWITRMIIAPRRKDFIKRFLRVRNVKNQRGVEMNREDLDDFIDGYLRRDGVFLIRMMALNAGEVITAEVVTKLYVDYINLGSSHDEDADHNSQEKLPLKGGKSEAQLV